MRRACQLVAVLLLLVIGSGSGAPAAAAEAPPKVTVDAGMRGWFDLGDHVVVTVTLEASTLFRGRIEVLATSGATVVRDIEVAGGTTKAFLLVAPTGFDSSPIKVQLLRGDSLVATKQVSMKVAEQVEIVGVMPALATRVGKVPEVVTMSSDTGRAQLGQLPVEVFDLGSAALDVYDTIIATSADLRSMSQDQRTSMLGWLNRGGRLLLDDDGDLSALPKEWQPGAAGYAWAGRGEVRIIDGAGSAGRWATIIEPSGSAYTDDANQFFGNEQTVPVQQDLARRAGVTLPSLGPLLWPLVVYWFAVSILVFVVLKMTRRLTFAWVAIPLLALIAAGGIIAYGNQWRSSGKPVASTFVDGYPGGGEAQVSVLAFSRDGGTSRVSLPDGWQSDSEADTMFFGFRSVASQFATGGDRADVSFRLEAGQVSTATVTGATGDVGLRVEAVVDGDDVSTTVTNTNPYPLHDVAVFGPGGAKYIGELAPGASATAAIDADPLPSGFGLFDRAWNNVPIDSSSDQIVERGVWGLASGSHSLYPHGMVRVAGWTADRPGDASASRLQTRAVVTTTAPVQPGVGPLSAAAVRGVTVRTPLTQFGNGLSDWVYRFMLPTSANVGPLGLELPAGLANIEIWNGTSWTTAVPAKRIVHLPAAAVVDGVVLARVPNDNQFMFNGDVTITLRGLTAKEVAAG